MLIVILHKTKHKLPHTGALGSLLGTKYKNKNGHKVQPKQGPHSLAGELNI